jgi:hypothetical protein
MGENQEQQKEELQLLYQTSITELEFFKRQQWSVTNYALLLYAAIVGVAQLLQGNVSAMEKLVLCLVATTVGLLGAYILWVLNNSIDVRKARLVEIHQHFSDNFRQIRAVQEKPEEALSIYVLLLMVVSIGVCVVRWLVYLKI